MKAAYRRLDYRDYSAWSLVREFDTQIGSFWRLMHESRRRAKTVAYFNGRASHEYESARRSAGHFKMMLLFVLEIRRAGRE